MIYMKLIYHPQDQPKTQIVTIWSIAFAMFLVTYFGLLVTVTKLQQILGPALICLNFYNVHITNIQKFLKN